MIFVYVGIVGFLYLIAYCFYKYDECDLKETKKSNLMETNWWKVYNEDRWAKPTYKKGNGYRYYE